jgi:hypothetical protein
MYRGTYDKIETNAAYLKKIHAKGPIENLHLFDEPYKLALKILDYGDLEDNLVAIRNQQTNSNASSFCPWG